MTKFGLRVFGSIITATLLFAIALDVPILSLQCFGIFGAVCWTAVAAMIGSRTDG